MQLNRCFPGVRTRPQRWLGVDTICSDKQKGFKNVDNSEAAQQQCAEFMPGK